MFISLVAAESAGLPAALGPANAGRSTCGQGAVPSAPPAAVHMHRGNVVSLSIHPLLLASALVPVRAQGEPSVANSRSDTRHGL